MITLLDPKQESLLYIPNHFREDRPEILHELMRQNTLAALVTTGPDGITANHIPLIFDPEPAPFGTLRGHLSRANSQWKSLAAGTEALAIFQGPSAYISPSWYPSKQADGRVVPTYNYVAVHAHGPLKVFDSPVELEKHLRKLTDAHESRFPSQWSVDDAPAEYVQTLLKGIVGVEMSITRLEGKWKVSQNRPAEDRSGVVEGLKAAGGAGNQAMGELICKREDAGDI
jgi:transcriptional regulator